MKRLLIFLLLIVVPKISPSSLLNKDIQDINMVAKPKATITVVNDFPASLIPDSILEKQLTIESGGNHTVTRNGETRIIRNSISGAVGIAQFLPSTWNGLKAKKLLPEDFSIENEYHQRIAHRIYMNQLLGLSYKIEGERLELALASYNAGYGRITKIIGKYGSDWKNHIPNQTKRYLKLILGNEKTNKVNSNLSIT
jgi:hypothetical protein